MPWTYEQLTGNLLNGLGVLVAKGYSGCGEGKNNCEAQEQHNVGPIPIGWYDIGAPEALDGGPHGPYVLPLTPHPGNQMFGRSGFLIHGDNIHAPGTASEGCMIFDRHTREGMWNGGDHSLEVIAKEESNGPAV